MASGPSPLTGPLGEKTHLLRGIAYGYKSNPIHTKAENSDRAMLSFLISAFWYAEDDIYKREPYDAEICDECLERELSKALFEGD